MSQKNSYIITTDAGTSAIIKAEIFEKFPQARVCNFENLPTKILIENLTFEDIAPFRFYHNIIALSNFIYLPDKTQSTIDKIFINADLPFMQKGKTFRITAKRFGNHDFTSIDLQKSVGKIIENRFAKKVSLENFDVNLRIDIIGNLCIWGEQLTQDRSETRFLRPFAHRAAVKQTLAHALIRLAEIETGMRVLDCTCGSGTLLLEANACYGDKINLFGLDLHEEYAQGAAQNLIANEAKADIRTGDARELSSIFHEKFDRIIANLPFGMVSGKNINLKSFYFRLTAEVEKVLHARGKAVFMTARPGVMKEVLLITKQFFVVEEFVFDAGGLAAHVLIIEKTEKTE